MRIVLGLLCLLGSLGGPLVEPVAGQQTADEVASDLFVKSLEAAQQAMEFYGPYDNSEELARVAELGYRIAQETGFTKFPFSFYLVDIPVPNAFALPGGQIFLTRGMLDLDLSDDMLAGLLGHEIGHVVENHGVRMQRRAMLLNLLSQTVLAGVIIASENDRNDRMLPTGGYDPSVAQGDRVMGAAAAGLVVSELLLRSYSREFEDEADDEGQRYAAGAGFDPTGYRQLMELMRTRLPESKEYGYWRTHPFFDSRVKAANVRATLLTVQPETSADDLRRRTQARLLTLAELPAVEEAPHRLVEDAALTAWPIGPASDRIRLARLHESRDEELDKKTLARDYGALLDSYRGVLRQMERLDPEGDLAATLTAEIQELEQEVDETKELALEVLAGGVFETDFLETFVSNYPDAPELPRVALELGNAYARLRRPEDAAEMYLQAWKSAPDSEHGQRARSGLRVLTPTIQDLTVLMQLSEESDDGELQEAAKRRMRESVGSFTKLANGSRFLKQHPESEFTDQVRERLNALAADLLGEATLYQRVGDHAKALDRINRILTEAPFSPAADKLRDDAILES